jgi:hypothetical protein
MVQMRVESANGPPPSSAPLPVPVLDLGLARPPAEKEIRASQQDGYFLTAKPKGLSGTFLVYNSQISISDSMAFFIEQVSNYKQSFCVPLCCGKWEVLSPKPITQ